MPQRVSQEEVAGESFFASADSLAEDAGISKRHTYTLLKEEGAPKPIVIGAKCVRYVRSEWREFLLSKRNAAKAEPKLRLASDREAA